MRILATVSLITCFSIPAAASAEAVLAEEAPRSVAVSIGVRADYLGQVIRLFLPHGEPLLDLVAVRKKVLERFAGSRQVKVVEGRWAWPSDDPGRKASSIQIAVLLPLKSEDESSMEAAQELAEAMEGLNLSHGKVQVEIAPVRLAVENPEQHRQHILDAIRLEMETTAARLGQGGGTTISGLEGPVRVRRSGDLEVELYLDYRVSVEVPPALMK